ncbi:MAG: protein kinase [Gemmatimonadales bacterium]|nr:protein kinase [Gemmatimonadales bacterium]
MTDKHLEDLKAALGSGYTIERELPGGGMSRVFVAEEHALGREVVIKVLPPELAAGVNRERFRREVQLAARLSHPYIVPLLHAGEHGELLWFTMPYIAGDSLRTRLERNGPCTMREALQLLRDVFEALAYAHSRGVIHRDIKPGNVLSDGQHAVVTDFGVAKALSAAMTTGIAGHTTSGMAIGTPAYMAPEQLAADPAADHRVDIYATGLLAYELLMGASPFAAPSPTATMTAQLTRTPDSLHTLRPDVPSAFSHLISKCLAKDPADRPADAQAVLIELDRISGAMAADHHRATTDPTQHSPRAASPWPMIVAAAAVVVLIGAGVYLAFARGAPSAAARVDTLPVMGGRDTTDAVAFPSTAQAPLTRADSLAIAQALRNELQHLDPVAAQRTPRVEPAPSTPTAPDNLELILARTDSLVRARLAVVSRFAPSVGGQPNQPAMGGTAPASPGQGTGPRRVVIFGNAGRGADSALDALSNQLAREFGRRLRRSGGWDVIVMEEVNHQPGGPPPQLEGAEALVNLTLVPALGDSASLRVQVRNISAGSAFGYRVVSGDKVGSPRSVEPFMGTISDALGVMGEMQRLTRGQTWTTERDARRERP